MHSHIALVMIYNSKEKLCNLENAHKLNYGLVNNKYQHQLWMCEKEPIPPTQAQQQRLRLKCMVSAPPTGHSAEYSYVFSWMSCKFSPPRFSELTLSSGANSQTSQFGYKLSSVEHISFQKNAYENSE